MRGLAPLAMSAAEYLQKSADPYFSSVRDLLEDWICHYPTSHRSQLVARLRDKNDDQFDSAFWELYLHEAYRRSGYSIEVEPKLSNTPRRPDFRMTTSNAVFYLEATSVRKPSLKIKAERRLAPLLDALIEATSPAPFHVMLTCHRFGKQSLPSKRAVRKVQSWLSTLDYVSIKQGYEDLGIRHLPRRQFDIDGWNLEFTAFPYDSQSQSDYQLLKMWSDMSTGIKEPLLDLRTAIFRSVRGKANAYPNLEYPLIIAIQINDQWHADDHHVSRALYGRHWFPQPYTSSGRTLLMDGDSLWITNDNKYKNSHISQVITATNLNIGNLHAQPHLWPNPDPSVAKLTHPDLFTDVATNQPGTSASIYFRSLPFP